MKDQQQQLPPAAAQGMGPGGVNDQAAAQSFKGCLNGSPGSWTLTSDKGKTAAVSGTDNQLSQYQGQEVRIKGVQTSDGSITVSSIDKVSDACATQSASNTATQNSSTSQNDINNQSSTATTSSTTQPSSSANMGNQSTAPATSTTPDNSAAMNNQSTMNSQSSTTTSSSTTTPGATTPPVSNQTPSNSVGTGQTTQSAAQTPSTSTSDQNTASSTSSSDQNSTANQNTTSNDQNANQGVHQYSDMDQNAGNNKANSKLPQTASPLPLIGLLGLGSLLTGLVSRRKK
jgi:hypothetical protein